MSANHDRSFFTNASLINNKYIKLGIYRSFRKSDLNNFRANLE